MRNIIILYIFILIGYGFSVKSTSLNEDQSGVAILAIENAAYLSLEEKQMLQEINLARTQPDVYFTFVKDLLAETVLDSVRLSGLVHTSIKKRVLYRNFEEVVIIDTVVKNHYESKITALVEIIEIFEESEPMKPLMPNASIYLSAKKHGEEQAENNYIDHNGLDGSWPVERLRRDASWITAGDENITMGKGSPRDIVINLLVDSGAEKRGNRKNILNSRWTHFACYNVVSLDQGEVKWWLQEFAY